MPNFLSHNPNIRRGLLAISSLALPLGVAACSSDFEKDSTPCDPTIEIKYVNCNTPETTSSVPDVAEEPILE